MLNSYFGQLKLCYVMRISVKKSFW